MMNASRRTMIVVGIAMMAVAAVGAGSIPRLFELCNTGLISGPAFFGVVVVVVALFGAGLSLLLRGRRPVRNA